MLPKIQRQLFEITIPSTEKKLKFRPFLTREEKILLTADESNNPNDLLLALKQIIVNCCATKINVDDMPLFDMEYIFIKLRARSVSNISEISIRDPDDEKLYPFVIDLDTLELHKNPKHTKKIMLTDSIGLIMKYPTPTLTENLLKKIEAEELKSQEDIDTWISVSCIEQIFTKDAIQLPGKDFKDAELKEWLLDLSKEETEKIKEFFDTIPKFHHELTYTNSLGEQKRVVLDGIQDFFQ